MSAHKYLLEVVVMKGLKRIKSTAWAKSAKVLSGIGLGISATLILNGCGEPAVFALQPLAKEPTLITFEDTGEEAMYIPSTPDTIKWGRLPNATDEPLLTVASGTVVVFDTLSHEGILEDQGRDPTEYFASHSIDKKYVLEDAIEIAGSSINHNFYEDGPHIVTGPIGIEGAMPGDVLKVEILKLEPRVPYGVISNRHYKGALPGEFPETPKPTEPIHSHDPETLGNVSIFTPTEINEDIDQWFGVLHNKFGKGLLSLLSHLWGLWEWLQIRMSRSIRCHLTFMAAISISKTWEWELRFICQYSFLLVCSIRAIHIWHKEMGRLH
jgi:hypothetical protein